jgi:hypothetical protein
MCDYSGTDDAQHYTKEELTPEEVEHRIRSVIKVGRDEELKLKMLMFENSSCPEVNYSSFRHYHLFFKSVPYTLFLAISTLPASELGPFVRFPWLKEITYDEEEPSSSPIKKCKAPSITEDAGPSHEELTAEEPVAPVRRRIHGFGGRMRGVGGRIISRHPSPALRA